VAAGWWGPCLGVGGGGGGGQWPPSDVWFYVSGGLVLLPPNVQQMFAENYSRIKTETPLWNAFYDEVIWSWWIAKFHREYNLRVDAFKNWRWTPYPSNRLCAGAAEALRPDCYMAHVSDKKYLSYYYTEWYVLNSRQKTVAGMLRWWLRAALGLRPAHAGLVFAQLRLLCQKAKRRITRWLS